MALVQNDYGFWIEDAVTPGKEGGERLNDNFDLIGPRAPQVSIETVDPDASDDSTAGFHRLSRWLNTTTNELWTCADPQAGAAVWIRSPNLNEDGELETKIIIRQDVASVMDTVVLDSGEPGWSTDNKVFRVGDNSTPGGIKIKAAKILERTLLTSEANSIYLDHQDADIIILTCTGNNLSSNKAFTVDASSGSPYPALNKHGLKPGSFAGQRITIVINFQSIHNDFGSTGITISFNGQSFAWNSDFYSYQGDAQRIFGTEVSIGDDGTYSAHHAFDLIWDGNFWDEPSPWGSLGSSAGLRSAAFGEYTNCGAYSIVAGHLNNVGQTPAYSAIFGSSNLLRGDFGFVAGFNNSLPSTNKYIGVVGANHGGISLGNAYTFQSGNGTRVRIPGQRAFAASATVGQGTSQGTDIIVEGASSGTTLINLAAGGIEVIVQPQTTMTIDYVVAGQASTTSQPGAAGFSGTVTVTRDNAGNTALVGTDDRRTSVSSGNLVGSTLTLTVDDATDKLRFQVVGPSGVNARWTARLTTAECSAIASST